MVLIRQRYVVFALWVGAIAGAGAHSVLQYQGDLVALDPSTATGSTGDVRLYFEPDEVLGQRRATYFIALRSLDLDGNRTPADPNDDVLSIRIRIGEYSRPAPHALNIFGSIDGAPREDDANMIVTPSLGEVSGIWTAADETFTGPDNTRLTIDSIGLDAAVDDLLAGQLFVEVCTVRQPEGELYGRLEPVPTAIDLKYFSGVGFQFTFNVYSPRLIQIESADRLSSWTLLTNLVATNSLVRSFDFGAADQPRRFYRVSELFFVHPTILTPPQSVSVEPGGRAVLSVVAEGVPEPEYQWYFDGEPLVEGTQSTLIIDPVTPTDAGDYSVRVFSAAGTAYSDAVQVTIIE